MNFIKQQHILYLENILKIFEPLERHLSMLPRIVLILLYMVIMLQRKLWINKEQYLVIITELEWMIGIQCCTSIEKLKWHQWVWLWLRFIALLCVVKPRKIFEVKLNLYIVQRHTHYLLNKAHSVYPQLPRIWKDEKCAG